MKRCVIVIGMHRSGTSLAMELLSRLGISTGKNLIPADTGNPHGYYENRKIVRIHQRILEKMGADWSSLLPLPTAWEKIPGIATSRRRLKGTLQKELAENAEPWGFKDPHMARFLPLWEGIFQELEIEPDFVLAVRHPAAVYRSLILRSPRLDRPYVELMWLQHNLDAVRFAGGRIKAVILYEAWFTHPLDQVRRLCRSLGLPSPDDNQKLAALIDDCIDSRMNHHDENGRSGFALPLVSEVFELLLLASRKGEVPFSRLREMDHAYQQAISLLSPWAGEIGHPRSRARRAGLAMANVYIRWRHRYDRLREFRRKQNHRA